MNRKPFVIALFAAALICTVPAAGMAKPDFRGCPGYECYRKAMPKLTEEQRAQITKLWQEHLAAVTPLKDELREKTLILNALSRNPNAQPSELRALAADISKLHAQIRTVSNEFRENMQKQNLPCGALANDYCQGYPRCYTEPCFEKRPPKKPGRPQADAPKITDEQRAQITKLWQEHLAAVTPLKDELMEKKLTLNALSRSPNAQPSELRTLAADISKLHAQLRTVNHEFRENMQKQNLPCGALANDYCQGYPRCYTEPCFEKRPPKHPRHEKGPRPPKEPKPLNEQSI